VAVSDALSDPPERRASFEPEQLRRNGSGIHGDPVKLRTPRSIRQV